MKMTLNKWLWLLGLVFVGVLTRWLPHPPNFSALLAIAIFAGALLPGPAALIVPVLSAVIGDAVLGFHDLMWVVYLSLLAMVFIGRMLPELSRNLKSWGAWTLAGLSGSVLFFVTTNFAVWWSAGMYPHNQAGFIACFVAALPFFQYTVASTLVFLFGLAAVHQLEGQSHNRADLSDVPRS